MRTTTRRSNRRLRVAVPRVVAGLAAAFAAAGAPIAAAPPPDARAQEAVVGEAVVGEVVVGEVAGSRLSATEVLAGCGDELAALRRKADDDGFRRSARSLVQRRVREILIERLMVHDAETALGADVARQRAAFARTARESLVERLGAGDAAEADRAVRERSGRGLDEMVDEQWRHALMQSRLTAYLAGRREVTAAAVEREYRRRRDRYRAPARRTVRWLATGDPALADAIEADLAAGASFEEVVAAGDSPAVRVVTRTVAEGEFVEPLEGALRGLPAGGHSARVDAGGRAHWFRVDRLEPPTVVPLEAAAPEIERDLEAARRRDLQSEYIETLLRDGAYTPADDIVRATLAFVLRPRSPRGDG